jgi:hypothetical protein
MEEAQLKRPLLFAPHFSYKNDALLCRYRLGTKREPGAAAAAESTAALSNFTARVDVYKGIHVEPGERIRIRATVLIAASIDDDVTVTLRQRPMGETSQAAQTNLTMVQVTAGRGVFEADLGALTEDWEWMIDVLLEFDEDHHHRGGDGAAQADGEDESQGARQQQLFVPPGAPAQWQSIVVMPS